MEPVVIDMGTHLVKAGFASPDQDPSLVLSTEMLKMKEEEIENPGIISEEDTISTDNVVYPVVRGMIKDWDAVEDLWRYIFYTGLGWEVGNEGQVLIAEPLLTPKISREKMLQIMFETFNVSGLYAVEQAVLSLYAIGRISGSTVDVGHGKTDIAPVWEGAVQHNAVKRFEFAGQDLTELLKQELMKHNKTKLNSSMIESLKETYAETLDDQMAYSEAVRSCQIEEHKLPDGQTISIGSERYLVGEALFQPSLLNIEEHSIVEQLIRSVSLCVPSENQRQMLENIVLCGGTSTTQGFDTRFQKEANLLSTPSIRPSLVKPPEYMPENTLRYSSWMGGAILAKVVFPQNQQISKADYDEAGPSIVHRKCF